MTLSLAIDIGGTFTDIVLLDGETGDVAVGKVLTSYPDPSQAVLSGVAEVLNREEIPAGEVTRLLHGTTLVTNTLIERKGARTALITTEGFRDALAIGREGRYDIYDLGLVAPEPLVERRWRLEVGERLTAEGQVLKALDEDGLRALGRRLREDGIEAVAVTFLHAYANPAHEEQAAAILKQGLPEATLSLSSQVAPEWREYERTSTTVANAYVQPLTERYLRGLAAGLADLGIPGSLQIMLSNAGTCALETAVAFPIRLVESGPAGGALAGAYWGREVGYEEVLAFDMGGTTAKAILSDQGEFPLASEAEVARVHRFKRGSGLPLLVPMLDMIEIGAGGGSIAHLNQLGLPAVGPESAGSSPGPACYGLGGAEPTVTDADLLLGYLNPDYFVGGQMRLDVDQARAAVGRLARSLEMDVEGFAWGIHQLVNENMAGAARVHAAERGLDIRTYAMVATGGAGPVHACGVAGRLGVRTVIVPPMAGVGSAFGMQLAPSSFDFARTSIMRLADWDPAAVNAILAELEAEGRAVVQEAGVAPGEIRVRRSADMRYAGQGFNIRFPLPDGEYGQGTAAELQELFEAEYRRVYGRLAAGVPVQAVNWRVTVSGPRPRPGQSERRMAGRQQETGEPLKGTRPARFEAGGPATETPVYSRYRLPAGFAAGGPAIIEEAESTAIIPPGWSVRLDASGSLIASRE